LLEVFVEILPNVIYFMLHFFYGCSWFRHFRFHVSSCWEVLCGIQTNFSTQNFHTWQVLWIARQWQMLRPTEQHIYSKQHKFLLR